MTGQQLKDRLDATNITMKAIADSIGVSPQSLNQVFKADDVKSGLIEKLSIALRLPMSYFYEGTGIMIHSNEDSFNTNDSKTIDNLSQIINEQRKRIDYLTDQLLSK